MIRFALGVGGAVRILVIANPISGGARGVRRAETLARVLERRVHEVELFLTRCPGDACKRAAEVGSSFDALVVAGGDGTLNEVLNGLPDPARTPIVPFPIGTANMLAQEFGISTRPEALAAILEGGRVRRVDVGRVGERRFFTVLGAGFDALVTRIIQERRVGPLGYRGYLRPILEAIVRYRPPHLTVAVDGEPPIEGAFVIVSKVRNYGGLFSVTDRARPDSGVLDVCTFRSASVPLLARYALEGWFGRLSRDPGVVYQRGRWIEIRAVEPVPVQMDGDYFGTTPVNVEVVPGGASLCVPAREGIRARRGG